MNGNPLHNIVLRLMSRMSSALSILQSKAAEPEGIFQRTTLCERLLGWFKQDLPRLITEYSISFYSWNAPYEMYTRRICVVDVLMRSSICLWFSGLHHQGIYSLSGRTFCRKISWSFEAAGLDVSIIVWLWILTSVSTALLLSCMASIRAIGKE